MMHLSRSQVREIDRRATAEHGIPSLTLMENAGRGCADLMMTLNPGREPVSIFCGPGNNGGDGYVMARHLHDHGWPVRVVPLAEPSTKDASLNFALADEMKLIEYEKPLPRSGWYVDALFGIGLSRPLEERYLTVIDHLKTLSVPVLAIDIPSGLDCDTGTPLGPCVQAAHTATFIAPKLGFTHPESTAFTGRVHIIDLGVPQTLLDQYA